MSMFESEPAVEPEEDWEAELGLLAASVAGPSYCGSPRRSPVGLRMRGVVSWPFRTPRRPRATPDCPAVRCDDGV